MNSIIERWRHVTSDLTIVCKDGGVMAIRDILAAASPVFAAMLNGPFIEGDNSVINMPEDSVDIVRGVIAYIQYGDIPASNPEDIVIFLDKYDVKITESEDDPLYKVLMHFATTRDGSIRIYSKIVNTLLLPKLRRDILHTINKWIKARFALKCDSCNILALWECKNNCANMDSSCSKCTFYIDGLRSHDDCKNTPCGTWMVVPKFDGIDNELIGRAVMEYYGK